MRAHQGETSELKMIKLCPHPIVHGMALFAGGGHIQSNVVDAKRPRVYEILLMARVAHRREPLELTHGGALVTGVAIHGGMRAYQRKAIQMLVDLLNRDVPAFYRMALFAIGSHLPLVNVGVAVGALRTDIRENHFGVALRASHAFVQPAQGIFGGVVVEFRDGADGLPAADSVAILTRNAETTVGTSRIGGRLRLPTGCMSAGEHRKSDGQMQQNCRSQGFAQPF